jgi:nitric oxide reductase subunit C
MRNVVGILITVLSTCVIFASLIYFSLDRIEPKEISWEEAQGKKVWDDFGCIQCHAILGNGGYAAPDLTKVVTLRSEEWLRDFFINPPLMPNSKHKHHKKLNEEQIGYLLQYLHLVEEINTLDWPPSGDKKNVLEVKRINYHD